MGKVYEYVGDIPELKGLDAQLRPITDHDEAKWLISINREKHVMASFYDHHTIFNGQPIGHGWYPFPRSHFRAVTSPQKRVF